MAFVVGVTLLAFCAAIVWKYALDGPEDTIVAQLHGFLFMIYALLCLDLGFRMRWGVGRLFFIVIAGMIPFLSFVAEHKVSGWVREETAAAHADGAATG
jgi:integral membrane protein